MPARSPIILAVALSLIACGETPTEPGIAADSRAGEWRTWVIANGSALRPQPPPANNAVEIDEIIAIQQTVTPAGNAMIQKWNTLPTTVWHDRALDLFGFYWILLPDVRLATPARSARAFALLHVAMYDALVATWECEVRVRAPCTGAGGFTGPRARAGERCAELPVGACGRSRSGGGGAELPVP